MADELPYGWVWRGRDIYAGPDKHDKPIAYQVGDGWMVASQRTPDELRAIADALESRG